MKSKTTRLLRILSDIRHAQRCTAVRAARAAAEADAVLAQQNDPKADERDDAESDDATTVPRSRIGSPH
jgi:septal ring factor EnvC (AmiA/AmiB activator)